MKVWAVANQKGGVGKTTTVVSLAGHLSKRGQNTLVIDMDPHGSMTSYFGMDPDSVKNSLYQVFRAENRLDSKAIQSIICETQFSKLSLMPASTALATLDRQLSGVGGMGLVVTNSLTDLGSQYQNVLIDCPPQLGVLMVNALAACEHLVIPVQTEFLALKGLERMLHTLKMINRVKKRDLAYTILPTMYDCRTRASVTTLSTLRRQYASQVWSSFIPIDTQFREASRMASPLPLMSPKDRGSVAYGKLLDDLNEFTDQNSIVKKAS